MRLFRPRLRELRREDPAIDEEKEPTIVECVFSCRRLFRLVCSHLKGKQCKKLRFVSRAFARRCFDYMLDHYLFDVGYRNVTPYGKSVATLKDLPRVPANVRIASDQVREIAGSELMGFWNDGDGVPDEWEHRVEGLDLSLAKSAKLSFIPNGVKTLSLNVNTTVNPSELPRGLKKLTANMWYCFGALSLEGLPPALEELYIEGHYVRCSLDRLPESIRVLEINARLHCLTLGKLPTNLKVLILKCDYFDEPLAVLPPGLTYLALGQSFDQPLGLLPPGLTYLALGRSFNQPLDHLPSSLRALRLDGYFGFDLDRLPLSLEELYLDEYDKPLTELPPKLKVLVVRVGYDHPIDDLPDSIKILQFKNDFNQPLKRLPPSLLYLNLGWEYAKPIEDSVVPETLKIFRAPCARIERLPDAIYDRANEIVVNEDFALPERVLRTRVAVQVSMFGVCHTLKRFDPHRNIRQFNQRDDDYYVHFFKKINLY